MLIVGTDTYVTVLEADEMVTGCHHDSLSEKWLAMENNEKECLLRTATYKIDCLPLKGYKHNVSQELQFPRGTAEDIPYKVRLAVVEECLAMIDTELLKRIALKQQGVSSVTLGTASESYTADNRSLSSAENILLSQTAYNYMRQYIVGSVRIV